MSSRQVDERVVQMKFDNADFQRKTAETISTLDKLKAALHLDGFKGLKNVGDDIKNLDMSGVTRSVDECSRKFSALEIAGVTAIAKITSSAMDFSAKFVKSMTIDQVTSGFTRYAQKTSAVQTIMAATAKDFADTGTQMKYVNEQLDKLSWFTDETSYSFNEMVNNIGKFTSNNIKLDNAVTAMMGIANWAAISGANINDANRAMYNLSQAIGSGSVKLIDWKSIENANMATYDFKKNVADTAVQLGQLTKAGDGVYKTLRGTTFTLAQFNTELDKGWFTSDVLLGTLKKYGDATEIIHELHELTGLYTSDIIDLAAEFKNGKVNLDQYVDSEKTSVEELTDLFTKLSDAENELGIRAFKAGQEAKTFQEAIDATAEAVSSGWMKTFELIFGNYEEAKALWTGLVNFLFEEFVEGGNRRNEILKEWKNATDEEGNAINARNELIRAGVNLLNLIIKPIRSVKKAFLEAFNLMNTTEVGTNLAKATKSFADFTERIQPTEKVLKAFFSVARAGAEVFKTIVYLITSFVRAIAPGVQPVQQVGDGLAGIVTTLSKYIFVAAKMIQNSKAIPAIFNAIGTALRLCVTLFKTAASLVGGAVVFAFSKLKTVISGLSTAISSLKKPFENVLATATKFKNGIVDSIKQNKALSKVYAQERDQLKEVGGAMDDTARSSRELWDEMSIGERVIYVAVETLKKIPVILGAIGSLIGGTFLKIISKVGSIFKTVFKTIYDDFKNSESIGEGFKKLLDDIKEGIKGMLDSLGIDGDKFFETIDRFVEKLKELKEQLTIGKVVAILFSVSILVLMTNISRLATAISGTFSAIGGLFGNLNKILKSKFLSKATPILEVAKAIALVAASLALLTVVNEDGKLWDATAALISVLATIGIFTIAVMALEKSIAKSGLDLTLPKLTSTMIALASAVGILSVSLLILSKIPLTTDKDFTDLSVKILAIITLMGTLVAATASLSIWAKELPKNSAALLALASAIAILVLSLNSLTDITMNDPAPVVASLGLLIMGLAGITKMAEGIKISNALAVLAIAVAFRIAMPAIEQLAAKISEISKTVIDANNEVKFIITFITVVGGVIAASIAVMKAVAPLIASVGTAVIEIGAGVFLFVQAANSLKKLATELSLGDIAKVLVTIGGLTAILVAFVALLHKIDKASREAKDVTGIKQMISISIMLLSFGATMTMLAKSLGLVAEVYQNGGLGALAYTTAVLAVLMGLVGLIIREVKKNGKAKGAIAAMTAMIASLSVLLLSLGILSLFKWYELIAPVASLSVVMYMLSTVFESIGKIKNVDMKMVIAMVGSLLIIAGSLVLLSGMEWGNVLAAGGAMSAVFLALIPLLQTISKSSGLANPKKIGVLASVCAMLLSIGGTLYLLSTIDTDKILVSLLGLSAAVLVLGLVVTGLSLVKAIDPMVLAGMVTVSACCTILALAATIMQDVNAGDFAIKIGVMAVALGILVALAGVFPAAAAALAALTGVLLGISAVLVAFGVAAVASGIGFTIICEAVKGMQEVDMLGVAGGLLALAGSLLAITVGSIGLGLAAIGMLGFAVALLAVGGALMLSASGFETLANTMTTLGSVDLLGIAGGLTVLSGGIALLSLVGLGLPLIAGGLLLFSVAISGLTGAMMIFNPAFMLLTTTFQTLATVNLLGIAAGISAIVPGIAVLALLAPSLPIVSGALMMLSAAFATFSGSFKLFDLAIVGLGASTQLALGYFDSIMLGMTGFIARISQFMGLLPVMLLTGSKTISSAAYFGGLLIGASYIKGFNDGAGFHSPVARVVEFEDTVREQFISDRATPAAAAVNGENVGKSWGAALWEKITGVFKSIVDGIKGLFKKITGIGEDLDIDLGLDPSNFSLDNIMPDMSQYTEEFNDSLKAFGGEGGINYEDWINEATQGTEGYTDAVGGATAATDEFSEATGGAGKAAKETKEELTDTEKAFQSLAENMIKASDAVSGFKSISASNPFEAYEEKEIIDPKNVIDNMKNISKTTSIWMSNINSLWERGVHTNLLKYLEELGIEGRDMVAAFVKMSDEQLQEAQGLFNHNLGYSEENAEAMLNSMHRKLEQVQQWGNNIKILIERGLDEGIIKKLTDLGPESADQVAAFASMTERQLKDANDMFTAAMEISADGAGSIIASFAETGDEAAMEFIQGINNGKYGYIEAGQGMGLAVLNALKEVTDQTNKVGVDSGTGLKNGMKSVQPQVSATAKNIGETAVNNADVSMGPSKTEPIGNEFVQGIINGMTAKAGDAYALAGQIAARCTSIMTGSWQIHSPSRVTMRLGRFFSEGAAIGIEAGAQNMYDAASKAADGTVDQFGIFASQVNDAINLNLNPIITPKLDLSYIRSQMSEINSMFSNGTIGVNGNLQNGDKSSGINTGQQITFTQNNYSPKALSRTEIYRYTHNQLSMAGGYFR